MPFEDDDKEEKKKIGLRTVSSKKSIFDKIPKKNSAQNLSTKVNQIEENNSSYQEQFANLASKFIGMVNDKTLKQNKEIFKEDLEKEVLADMIRLAEKVNCDVDQPDSAGSLAWITILLKICLIQRDKINLLEYNLSLIGNVLKSIKKD